MKRKEHQLINTVECKYCYKCKKWLPLCSFGSDKSKWDGFNAACKECEKERRNNEEYKKRAAVNSHNSYEKYKNDDKFKLRRKKNKENFFNNRPLYSQEYHLKNKETDNARSRKNYWKNKEVYNIRSRKNNAKRYKTTHPHAGEKVQSQGEEFVADWLKAHGIHERFIDHGRYYHECFGEVVNSEIYYVRQYWCDDLKDKKKLTFDFYIPAYQIVIEVNGIKHYAAKSFAKDATKEDCLKEFAKTLLHDKKKRTYAEEHNVKVFDIKYGFKNYNFSYLEEKLTKIMKQFLTNKEGMGLYI